MKRIVLALLGLFIAVPALILALQVFHEPGSDIRSDPATAALNPAEQIARGNYLARAGDCMACHTPRGGAQYAGGRIISTPFGNLTSPNITPDSATGIGSWSADDFWRALHNGKSKDGSFLYPAFPYPNYTKITRSDSDALFAYFKSLPAVNRPNQPHELRFPYNQRLLLAGWRALYFTPGEFKSESSQSAEWNRGAYLVQGLGHCNACHTNRNALGATDDKADLAGGMIPIVNWYAPSLTSSTESGLGDWETRHIADLLKTGVSAKAAVYGPMAEVVRESLQHLTDPDIGAMTTYLKALPKTDAAPAASGPRAKADTQTLQAGAELYEKHCVDCHQAKGEGMAPAYPPLAGNRAVTASTPINPVRMVLNGGYPPSTHGNPRPYGMPPFGPALNDNEVAAVVTYIRNSWGNQADAVTPLQVSGWRAVPVD